jgi:glycosyltransferase involved in cell wall biosynthesis
LRDLLRSARALVFPSLWYEGQPLTILEAKAYGVPIVVADSCAGRDEVEDGVTGLWFKGGDAGDLARVLLRMKDDALVARFSAAAHASYWAAPRTPEKHVEGLLSIYRDMLARGASTARDDEPAAQLAGQPLVSCADAQALS